MNMQQLREIAKEHGVKPGSLKKIELVQAVQVAEGNEACFGTGKAAHCGQEECLWKVDCN
jgi:hypothetical protein